MVAINAVASVFFDLRSLVIRSYAAAVGSVKTGAGLSCSVPEPPALTIQLSQMSIRRSISGL